MVVSKFLRTFVSTIKTTFNMKLQATKEVKVFIDKKMYGNTKIEHTDVGKIPEDRRELILERVLLYNKTKRNILFR